MTVLRQGTNQHPHRDRGVDLYETPPEATRALLKVEPITPRVWEPAAGRGAIGRVLMKAGYRVSMSDLIAHNGADPRIHAPVDFLTTKKAPCDCKMIITNPPFRTANLFIRHGLKLVPTVIVLQRLVALEGVQRSDLVDHHLVRVWLGRERLAQMHRDNWTGNKLDGGTMPFAWFVFRRNHPDPGRIELRRISWRD